jgi:predicted nucleotidyltransferase component of viral defense system
MDLLARHEKFEMEVLYQLNTGRILEKLVFGEGTMLRLCHELNRYSADLDFWLIKAVNFEKYLNAISSILEKEYEVTDKQIIYFSLLLEVRSKSHPKRLKIEIRKEIREWQMEKSIAFSKFSNRQVLLYTHSLRQMMLNKIEALLDRGEIRDAFDIEFLMRKGISLPKITIENKKLIKDRLISFGEIDFKVKLGSVLNDDMRAYYIKNRFKYLENLLFPPHNNIMVNS